MSDDIILKLNANFIADYNFITFLPVSDHLHENDKVKEEEEGSFQG